MIAVLAWLFGNKKKKTVVQMITKEELVRVSDRIEEEDDPKVEAFLEKINLFRNECGIPMVATSYYRSRARQLRIYRDKAAKKQFPFTDGVFDRKKVPMNSRHLYFDACDFADSNKKLAKWVQGHLDWCKKNGFYFEDFDSTPTWIHIQTTPPRSGNTVFKP